MSETVRSGERIFDLLEALTTHRGPVSLAELAEETSLSKTTAHRLLQTLCDRKYAYKTNESKYLIGPKLIELASYHIEHLDLYRLARPLMVELHSAFQMPVYLGKVVEDRIVYLELVERQNAFSGNEESGVSVPAYPSSIGKCMFASMSGDEIEKILYHHPLVKYTDSTITDPAEYKLMLRKVRVDGWAIDDEEYLPGNRSVGAPVYDFSGTAIASIAISGSPEQLSDERIPIVVEALKRTAAELSTRLGYIS